MNGPTEIRFAPAVAEMRAFLEPFRPWIESALGAPLDETLTFELEVPFGELVAEDLLAGTPLDRGCLARADSLRALVERWELPPGASPRIHLYRSRDRQALVTAGELAWDPHWKETPVALWLRGLTHPLVAAEIPYVSYQEGLVSEWRCWALVRQREAAAALTLLRGVARNPTSKTLTVVGGMSVRLSEDGYDWDRVILEPGLTRLVRDDFEGFLHREEWFRRHRLPFRRGYFLYGPPGNGKTSIIRVMASHPAIAPYSLDFSNEDVNNASLTELFERAGQSAPALVIFEDLDRLFGKAGSGDNRTKITLQHLLNCLDGLGSQDGVIVVATANDPTALDPAILRRPGRFDRMVPCPPPSLDLRREQLRRLAGETVAEEGLDQTARDTEGFSFAQLREAYILAGQLAFEKAADEISRQDLTDAIRLVRGESVAVGNRVGGNPVGFEAPVKMTPC